MNNTIQQPQQFIIAPLIESSYLERLSPSLFNLFIPNQTIQQSSISPLNSSLQCQDYPCDRQKNLDLNDQPYTPQQSISVSLNRHFNPDLNKKKEYPLRKQKIYRKKCRSHNLKTIACHLIHLIESNSLTIKQLGYLLFEIVCQTKFGIKIISQEYSCIEDDQISEICLKYKNDNEQESSLMRRVVKNVRRRLYDALNVMLASQVIYRLPNQTFEIIDYKDQTILDHLQEEQCSNPQKRKLLKLRQQIKENQISLQKKIILLNQLKRKVYFLSKFVEKNSQKQNQVALYLPILAVRSPSKFTCSMQRNSLECKGESFTMLSDLQIVKIVVENEIKGNEK